VVAHCHPNARGPSRRAARPSPAPSLRDEGDADRLVAEAGPLDMCAAVAGVWPEDEVPVWELPLERWRANVTVAGGMQGRMLRDL
jgi:hypothetical protein